LHSGAFSTARLSGFCPLFAIYITQKIFTLRPNLLPMDISIGRKAFRIVFVAFIAMLFLIPATFAQGSGKSVVTLKSGEVVKGKILEAVPDQYIKIELDDKTVRKINSSEISEIANADIKKPAKIGFSAMVGVYAGYDLTSSLSYVMVIPRAVFGIRINEQRVGMGLGFIYGSSNNWTAPVYYGGSTQSSASTQKLYYLPVYFNYHGEFGKKKILPSIDVSLGYAANLQKGYIFNSDYVQSMSTTQDFETAQKGLFYGEISPGVSFKVAKSMRINVAANLNLLTFQEIQEEKDYLPNDSYSIGTYVNSTVTRIAFSVGGSVNLIF
jgi:hypothetical protein